MRELQRFCQACDSPFSEVIIEIRTRLAWRDHRPNSRGLYAFVPVPSRITLLGAQRRVLLRLMQTAKTTDSDALHWSSLTRTRSECADPIPIVPLRTLFSMVMLHYNAINNEHRWTSIQYFDEPDPIGLHLYNDQFAIKIQRLLDFAALTTQIDRHAVLDDGWCVNDEAERLVLLAFQRFQLTNCYAQYPCTLSVFRALHSSHRSQFPNLSFSEYYDWYRESLTNFELNAEGQPTGLLCAFRHRLEQAVRLWSRTRSGAIPLNDWVTRNFAIHPMHQPFISQVVETNGGAKASDLNQHDYRCPA